MLQRVTATQQCVSTRCDLWWEKEILCSVLPVFSYMFFALGVSNTVVQSSRAVPLVSMWEKMCWRRMLILLKDFM